RKAREIADAELHELGQVDERVFVEAPASREEAAAEKIPDEEVVAEARAHERLAKIGERDVAVGEARGEVAGDELAVQKRLRDAFARDGVDARCFAREEGARGGDRFVRRVPALGKTLLFAVREVEPDGLEARGEARLEVAFAGFFARHREAI